MPDHVIAGIFSIVCAAIGGLFGYRSAIGAAIRKERNEAVIEFRNAFIGTLLDIDPHLRLYHGKFIDVFAIIKRDFTIHTKAMLRFKQYIPTEKIEEFERAWQEYGCYKAEDGKFYPSICQYGSGSQFNDGEDKSEKAKRTINMLLSFAELDHKSPFESNQP
jgi:hypothetical protein